MFQVFLKRKTTVKPKVDDRKNGQGTRPHRSTELFNKWDPGKPGVVTLAPSIS